MVDLSVKVGSVALPNPIMPASGTFSHEFGQVIDLDRLGALVTKTVSRPFRPGNPPPRVHEIEAGMINSIGLPTKGLEYFLQVQLPEYRRYKRPWCAASPRSIEILRDGARCQRAAGRDRAQHFLPDAAAGEATSR
jgi:dihydroorotate dehydrogenase (NAD+) catalytic subunit